jgi:hypothetical protein
MTLDVDAVVRAVAAPAPRRRVLVPAGASSAARRLRSEGWITVAAFGARADASAAQALGCTHLFDGEALVEIV